MKEHCVPLHLAMKLKKAGFKEPCLFGYDKCDMFFKDLLQAREFDGVNYNSSAYCCSAPFWEQVIDWFRKEHNWNVGVVPRFYEGGGYHVYVGSYITTKPYNNYKSYGDYEHAREMVIDTALDKINGVVEEVDYKKTRFY